MKIIMCKTVYSLEENKKTVYKIETVENKTITETELKNITEKETLKWFKKLGGSESLTMGYTCQGYKPIILKSKSPNKEKMIIREFEYL